MHKSSHGKSKPQMSKQKKLPNSMNTASTMNNGRKVAKKNGPAIMTCFDVFFSIVKLVVEFCFVEGHFAKYMPRHVLWRFIEALIL